MKSYLAEIVLISYKQAEAVKKSGFLPLKPADFHSENVLKAIGYPIDKKSKNVFDYDEDSFMKITDSKLRYSVMESEIAFLNKVGDDKLKSVVPKEDIFSKLKCLLYIYMTHNRKKRMQFHYTPMISDAKGDHADTPIDDFDSYYSLKTFSKLEKLLYKAGYSPVDFFQDFDSFMRKKKLDNWQARLDLTFQKMQNFLSKKGFIVNQPKLEEIKQAMSVEILDLIRKQRFAERIENLRSKLYASLLSKFDVPVRKSSDKTTYYFTVNIDQLK